MPRPYLNTFLDYVLHADSLFHLAIWTRLPKSVAVSYIKLLGLDLSHHEASTVVDPALMAFWGSEESGVASEQFLGGAEQGPKDLDLVSSLKLVAQDWDLILYATALDDAES
mgnify:FL=1